MVNTSESIFVQGLSDALDRTFDAIATSLTEQGYCVLENALPMSLAEALADYVTQKSDQEFTAAGIGRDQLHHHDQTIRSDAIDWITGESHVGRHWLAWAEALKQYLNRRLFLGLFSFESHFARYHAGDFYLRHYDAFKGQANRILSMVVYLNKDWQPQDGGELVLYRSDDDQAGMSVLPEFGTVVVFLSEEFPHEVKPARRDRHSIACWYRINGSVMGHLDPPS